jgi:hypothetical protein
MTVVLAAGTAQNGRATVILQKKLPLNKNHDRGPQIFTYQPLNFQKNMFAVHDFTHELLNFQNICLQCMISKKTTSNFVTIHSETPLSTNIYIWASKLLGKNWQPRIFQKKTQISIQPTHRP